ncbi:MAG: 5'/3'-nucleotidase SurE [Anaerolineales bacterium]
MKNTKPHILLTNDDGIRSPGLWSAARELSRIGYVTVAAPREQSTGMGRSLPSGSDGIIRKETVQVNGQEWQVYAVGGSPAQAVLHAFYEILPQKPDLVVSGINYGENLSTSITVSGTIGAAMEAASLDVPAIAVSLQTDKQYHLSHSEDVDFSAAGYFAAYFAQRVLERGLPPEVDFLKVEVPAHATRQTEWRMARLSHLRYYEPLPVQRDSWEQPGSISYKMSEDLDHDGEDTDVTVVCKEKMVAVTPLNLDMTARVKFEDFDHHLRE